MKTMIPRIRSVRPRKGGAKIMLLPRCSPTVHDEIIRELKDRVEYLADEYTNLTGFALVVWTEDQTVYSSYRNSESSTVNKLLIPALAQEALSILIARQG